MIVIVGSGEQPVPVDALPEAGGAVLVVATEPVDATPDGLPVLDLWRHLDGLSEWQQQLCLLDVVRCLRPERVLVAGSRAGVELVDYYGTVLRNEMVLEVAR